MTGEFVLKEPKSKRSRRTIRLPPFVLDALADHRKRMLAEGQDVKTGTVFVTKNGTYLGKSSLIRQVFKPLLKRAGVREIRFHDLRHTHASILLAHGESIKAVCSRLGHSDVALAPFASTPICFPTTIIRWGKLLRRRSAALCP